jgi:hypothetical protein
MRHEQQYQVTKRQGRPRLRSSRTSGSRTHRRRTVGTCLPLDAARRDEGHIRPAVEAKASEANIHLVDVKYPYQPIRGIMCLPLDCWNLNQFDFDPLPTDRQRASTSAAAAQQRQSKSPAEQIHQYTPTDERECIMSINTKQQLRLEAELLALLIARTDAEVYDPLIVVPALFAVTFRIIYCSVRALFQNYTVFAICCRLVERFLIKIERAAAAPIIKALRRKRAQILID